MGEHLPERPRDTLYSYVSRLRAVLAGVDEVAITQRSGGYLLTADPETVDLHRFRGLMADAGAAQDDQQTATLLTRALAQWTGVAFGGLDGAWAARVRETLARQRFTARLDLAEIQLHSGRCDGLSIGLAELTAEHPLDERLASQLMLALYRDSRQGDALREYERIRRLLAAELGADPGPMLRRVHEQILTSDAVLAPPADPGHARSHPVPRQLPAAPQHFTGRGHELAVLSAAQIDGSPQSTVVISAIGGAGGIGKTCLALHWAHRHAHRFPDGQLYVDLRGFGPSGEPMSAAAAIRRMTFLNRPLRGSHRAAVVAARRSAAAATRRCSARRGSDRVAFVAAPRRWRPRRTRVHIRGSGGPAFVAAPRTTARPARPRGLARCAVGAAANCAAPGG
ncbi:AfsR/SARP family transcriptional regulator [Crossiella sp. NPDC003009]